MNLFTKFQHQQNRYEKLNTGEDESLKQVQSRGSNPIHWIQIFVLLCSIGVSAANWDALTVRNADLLKATPGFAKFLRRNVKFVGSFESVTPYRGPPSPEIDAAWARFTTSPWADGTAVVLGVGTKEDLVRKFTFHKYSYYKNTGGVFDRPIEAQKNHVEIIRQVIMCNGDTGLITFHWVAGNPVAYPDFNTWHSCRDPEEILALAKEREAPMRQQVTKTQGIINMPTPP
ncbi:hypothetical protein CHU98_g6528 [Xylaria longipes]|nr:hypothetical protein CHU98_g6528 [Xylaria longipes]